MELVGKEPTQQLSYKEQKKNRRRGEILDAAATVFARKGYFAATMQDIAEILGMRPASLYYYFDSKESALTEVCRRGGREFADKLKLQIESGKEPLKIIEEGVKIHLDSKWRDYVANFAFNRQNLPESVLVEMNTIAREYVGLWVQILDLGKLKGDIPAALDTRFASSAILAICNSSATTPGAKSTTSKATIQNVLSLILGGILRPEIKS